MSCSSRRGINFVTDQSLKSHGRDHKLIVWKITEDDEGRLSVSLPLEDTPTPRPQPWVIHLLEVNTMNFCSFAACLSDAEQGSLEAASPTAEALIAVPNTLASEAVSSRGTSQSSASN